jgi:hypothetical protein
MKNAEEKCIGEEMRSRHYRARVYLRRRYGEGVLVGGSKLYIYEYTR